MAASSDRTDGLQSSPYMHHMQPSGGGQMGGMPPAYFDHAQQQQYSMGPHSAPPMPKQHMSFPYPPSSHERLMSMPSTSGQTGAPPSYYATGRTPSLVSRTTSGQPRMQQLMGPPVPRKQQVYVFSTDLGNKAADEVRNQRMVSIIQWHQTNVSPHTHSQLRQQQLLVGASSLKRERAPSPLASSAQPTNMQRPPSRKTPQPRTPKTPSSVKQPATPSGDAPGVNGQPAAATSSSLPSTPAGAGSLCSSVDGVLSTSADLSLSEDDNPLRKMERMTQEPGLFEPPNKLPRLSSPKEHNPMLLALGTSKCSSKASTSSQQQSQVLAPPPQNGQLQMLDDNLTPEMRRSREQKLEKLKAMERFLPTDPMAQQMPVGRPIMNNGPPPPHGMYACPPQQQQMQQMYRPHPSHQHMLMVSMNASNVPVSRGSPSMDMDQAERQATWERMVHEYEMDKMKNMNAGAPQEMGPEPPMADMFMAQRSKPVGMVPPNARNVHQQQQQQQQQRFVHAQMFASGPHDGQFPNRDMPPQQRMMGPPTTAAGPYGRQMDPRFMQPHPGVFYGQQQGPPMFSGDPADPYGMHHGKPPMMNNHNEMVGVYGPLGGPGGGPGGPPPRQYQPPLSQGGQQPTVNNTFINAHVSIPQVNIQNIVPNSGQMTTMNVQQMSVQQMSMHQHQHQHQQQQPMRPPGPIPMGAPMPNGGPHSVMRAQQGMGGGQPPIYDYGPNGAVPDYNCWPEPLTNLDSKVPSQKVQYYPTPKQEPPGDFGVSFQGSMMSAQQMMKTDGQKVCIQQQANFASVSAGQPPQQLQQHFDFQQQMYGGQSTVRR